AVEEARAPHTFGFGAAAAAFPVYRCGDDGLRATDKKEEYVSGDLSGATPALHNRGDAGSLFWSQAGSLHELVDRRVRRLCHDNHFARRQLLFRLSLAERRQQQTHLSHTRCFRLTV